MAEITSTKTVVEVKNRNNGFTGYTIPDRGITRNFNIGETKKIDIEELQALSYVPGGEYLLRNYLIIGDSTALDYLNIPTEPEYFYTEKEIEILLLKGTLDQLEDCLNFAPQGVIDLVKDMSVKLAIPDTNKRKLIFEKTGYSVDNAIKTNEILAAEDAEPAKEEKTTTGRKAAPIAAEPTAPQRKAAPVLPKYNVVVKEGK